MTRAMSNKTTPTLRAYSDWRKLRSEAVAGKFRDIVQFIADNTSDPRADDRADPHKFAPGYLDSVRMWVEKQR